MRGKLKPLSWKLSSIASLPTTPWTKTTTLSCLDLLHQGNRSVEISSWMAEQAPRCKPQRVAFAMIYLEDGDGNILSGPSSPWCLNDVSVLEGFHDAQRGAVFS